jgi:exodeoxyribonuclease VII small subunit
VPGVVNNMADRTKQENPDQPNFEQSLKRLEEIVHLLEEGDLGLNDALQRYEEGVKLLRQAYDLLQRAERKIELLSGVDAEGNPITTPFDDTATADKEEKPRRRKS